MGRMKQYLRWKQVQQRLTEHAGRTGETYSFFDAARELWQEGAFQYAESLPPVSFYGWDCSDLDELERLMDQVPVDLDIFYRDFQNAHSAQASTERIIALDIIPIRIARDQAIGPHEHDSFESLYVVRGKARLQVGGSVHILEAGTYCMVSPHVAHDAVAGEDCLLISISFAEQTVEQTLARLLSQDSVISDFFRSGLGGAERGYLLFHVPNQNQFLPILRSIFHECYGQEEYARTACADYLEILLIYLLRLGDGSYEGHALERERRGAVPMLTILKYIQANYRTASLGEIAAAFHYEPSYLGKQIRRYTGRRYTEIIRDLRLAEAKRLLRTTDLSIEKVGEQAGFNSLIHFSRSFRAAMGVPPSAYRNAERIAGEKENT